MPQCLVDSHGNNSIAFLFNRFVRLSNHLDYPRWYLAKFSTELLMPPIVSMAVMVGVSTFSEIVSSRIVVSMSIEIVVIVASLVLMSMLFISRSRDEEGWMNQSKSDWHIDWVYWCRPWFVDQRCTCSC